MAKKGIYFAYWSPRHGYAVFSNWQQCSKWATGLVASCAYYKGGFLTEAEAAAAAGIAGGLGLPVEDGWIPQIVTDAPPTELAAPAALPDVAGLDPASHAAASADANTGAQHAAAVQHAVIR